MSFSQYNVYTEIEKERILLVHRTGNLFESKGKEPKRSFQFQAWRGGGVILFLFLLCLIDFHRDEFYQFDLTKS